jgi:hypothetical protein
MIVITIIIAFAAERSLERSEIDQPMKRSFVLLAVVVLVLIGCSAAESESTAVPSDETPTVTVFRSPT